MGQGWGTWSEGIHRKQRPPASTGSGLCVARGAPLSGVAAQRDVAVNQGKAGKRAD